MYRASGRLGQWQYSGTECPDLYSYDTNGMRKYLNAMAVSKLTNVTECIKVGFGRCKVTLKNYKAANEFVNDVRIKEKGLNPKILPHFVSKAGIVFDIPIEISEKEFLESTRSSIEI